MAVGKLYRVILADPPWDHHPPTRGQLAGRSWFTKDGTLTVPVLCSGGVRDLAAPDSLLFLWCLPRGLIDAVSVLLSWGYGVVGNMVWVKLSKSGAPVMSLSPGHIRYCHELLLVGRRGRIPVRDHAVRSVILAPPARDDARKPDEVYSVIERITDGPYLELFARKRRRGWDAYGNGVDGGSDVTVPGWER